MLTTAERRRRRPYEREWARQKRFAHWLAVNEGQTVCQWKKGPYVCGGELTMRDGHLSCVWCALKSLRLCRDCLTPIEKGPNAVRCHGCWIEEQRAAGRRYDARHPGLTEARYRARFARWKLEGDPRYTAKREYQKAYRAANPDRVRVWKANWVRSEKGRACDRAQRERRAEARRRMERERHHGVLGPRYCLGGCGTTLRGRWKKCRRCKISKYVNAIETLGKRRSAPVGAPLVWHNWPTFAEFKELYARYNTRV